METTVISCEKRLMDRIAELKIRKAAQEEVITGQFQDIKRSLNIGTILKESVAQLAEDKETRRNLVKLAATTGTTYIIEKVIGSNNSIKRFLGSMLAEKVSNTFIGKLISRF